MPRAGGYALSQDPDKAKPLEWDTVTCSHCQKVIFVKPGSGMTTYLLQDAKGRFVGEEMGAMCRMCMAPVCLRCHGDGRCIPWEKRIEISEARERLLQAVGVV